MESGVAQCIRVGAVVEVGGEPLQRDAIIGVDCDILVPAALENQITADNAERAAIYDAMNQTLAALHNVDVDAVGLGELGRREGYIERQLRRWRLGAQ